MQKELKEAISLVFRNGSDVLVLKRSANKNSFPNAWSIPSTYVHPGESVSETANRLVRRKLGLQRVTLKDSPLGVSPVVDRGEYELRMTDYVVESQEGEIGLDSSEYVEMKWVTPEQLLEIINTENGGEMGECTRTFLISEGLL